MSASVLLMQYRHLRAHLVPKRAEDALASDDQPQIALLELIWQQTEAAAIRAYNAKTKERGWQ